mmetsp:Transcript_19025/g.38699  ORF Transcript_19025/g.38699 Transcript_19025/m.38699 type:complete len:243 (+) Transcript_19025:920-1648(+)
MNSALKIRRGTRRLRKRGKQMAHWMRTLRSWKCWKSHPLMRRTRSQRKATTETTTHPPVLIHPTTKNPWYDAYETSFRTSIGETRNESSTWPCDIPRTATYCNWPLPFLPKILPGIPLPTPPLLRPWWEGELTGIPPMPPLWWLHRRIPPNLLWIPRPVISKWPNWSVNAVTSNTTLRIWLAVGGRGICFVGHVCKSTWSSGSLDWEISERRRKHSKFLACIRRDASRAFTKGRCDRLCRKR